MESRLFQVGVHEDLGQTSALHPTVEARKLSAGYGPYQGKRDFVKSWQQKKSKIRAELTFTLTFTLTTLTHRDAALTPASREQGEDEGEHRATLTLVLTLPLISSLHMDAVATLGSYTLFRVEPAPS